MEILILLAFMILALLSFYLFVKPKTMKQAAAKNKKTKKSTRSSSSISSNRTINNAKKRKTTSKSQNKASETRKLNKQKRNILAALEILEGDPAARKSREEVLAALRTADIKEAKRFIDQWDQIIGFQYGDQSDLMAFKVQQMLRAELKNVQKKLDDLKSKPHSSTRKKAVRKKSKKQNSIRKTDGSSTTIQIGEIIWMMDNLAVETSFSKRPTNQDTRFACFYTWDGAADACPSGWRIPTREDFERLIETLDGDDGEVSSEKLLEGGKSGLNLLLAGGYNPTVGYGNVGVSGHIWSSTEKDKDKAYALMVYVDNAYVHSVSKKWGLPVRCVKE